MKGIPFRCVAHVGTCKLQLLPRPVPAPVQRIAGANRYGTGPKWNNPWS